MDLKYTEKHIIATSSKQIFVFNTKKLTPITTLCSPTN